MRLTLSALGLKECYVDRKICRNVSIVMSNADSPIGSDMFGSIAVDWCAGSGRGFTESSDRRRKPIMNLLMHGCADEYSSNGYDIPSGTVKALKRNSSAGTDVDYIDVGAEQIKPSNTGVYSQ